MKLKKHFHDLARNVELMEQACAMPWEEREIYEGGKKRDHDQFLYTILCFDREGARWFKKSRRGEFKDTIQIIRKYSQLLVMNMRYAEMFLGAHNISLTLVN